jgi:hypothetical protein
MGTQAIQNYKYFVHQSYDQKKGVTLVSCLNLIFIFSLARFESKGNCPARCGQGLVLSGC